MIRERWRQLLVGALVALGGQMWLRLRFGGGDDTWELTRIGGVVLGAAFAFGAMQRELRAKWPAAAALVCIAPISRDAVSIVVDIRYFVRTPSVGLPILIVVGGAAYGVLSAVRILIAKPLPPVEPPIAPARVVDDD